MICHKLRGKMFMPVIPIEVPENTAIKLKKIREQIKQAALKTLAPRETKYNDVAIREASVEIGDGLPLVEVDLRPGREPPRKKNLVNAIAAVLKNELDIDVEDVYVLLRETSEPGHYTGGTRLPVWVPADK